MHGKIHIGILLVLAVCMMACSLPTAESYYRQGRQYREAGEPVAAMNAFIAATRVHSCEYTFKGRSFSNMATMCRIGEQHELAYALYEQSLCQFELAQDTPAQAYALNNMAWEQAVLAHKEEALRLVDKALSVCSDTAVQNKVLESQAAACLYAEEYDSVLYYAQQSPSESVYMHMLMAQAYTFIGNNDSALFYAKQVVTQTSNPRYLDDVYYILTFCDSTAQADEVRALAATRTDIQRDLERNNPEWIEAMLLAENALKAPKPTSPKTLVLLVGVLLVLLAIVSFVFIRLRKRKADSLEQECRILRRCTDLRKELNWNNYQQFRLICNLRLSGIVDKLERRGLSEREIRICVLVLIGLSYAQMAEVLIRAENGIGKDKYLVAKHLGVSVKDLQDTLRHIARDK